MTDWTPVVDMFDKVIEVLEQNPALDPDGAVRLAVWDDSDTPYPGDDEPGADVFEHVEMLIEGYIAREDGHDCGDGIAWIPPERAIQACRAEAQRFRSLGYGT